MHLKRQKATTKLPIPRKGTKFVARAFSHLNSSVPLVIAVRDMLKLARNSAEVRKMINQKLLTINGKPAKELRESIRLFNILGADKNYVLTLLPTGKFVFNEVKNANIRLCKVVGKTLIKGNKIQLNLHDGTNIISTFPIIKLPKRGNVETEIPQQGVAKSKGISVSDGKAAVGDSLLLSLKGEIEHIPLEKGRNVLIISGRYAGLKGKINSVEGSKVSVKLENKTALLEKACLIVQ